MVSTSVAAARSLERPTVASWFVTLYALVAVGRWTELIPGAADIPLAKIAFAGALLAVLLERDKWERPPLYRIPLARIAVALYVLALASVSFSIWKSYSLSVAINHLLTVFASFLVAIKALPNWASIKRLLRGLVYSGAILAVTGLTAFVGGRFRVIQSYDPNDLAYVLVAVLPLAVGFGRISAGWRKIAWISVGGLLVVAALLTQSRGGLVALIVMSVCLLLWEFPTRRQANAAPHKKRSLVIHISIFIVLAAASWSFLPEDARQRFSSLTSLSSDYNVDMTNDTGRLALWKRGFIAAMKRPIGYGIGNFEAADGQEGGRYKAAHNSFLLILVELGVLGLILYIRMYVRAWRSLGSLAKWAGSDGDEPVDSYQLRTMAHAMKLLFIGTIVAGFFLSQTFANVLWLSFAAVAAMAATAPAAASVQAARIWAKPRVGRA
jgi:O-antigen ligase